MNQIHLKLSVICLTALITISAGTIACAGANKPPVAHIDSINPSYPQTGQAIIFVGHGNDSDGNIVSYEWRSSIDGVIGNTSTLSINALSAGQHTISLIVCDNDGACSNKTTANLVIAHEPLNEQSAAELVINSIIEPMNYSTPIIGFKLNGMLKPGDTVAPYNGEKYIINEDSYFYFIDLYPAAFYAHDTLFVTVDKKDGDLNISQEQWWPIINDDPPGWISDEDQYYNTSNWFFNSGVTRPTAASISAPQIGMPAPQHQWYEASVVVNGHAEGETLGWDMDMNAWEMWVLFDSYITPGNTYEITPPPIGSNTPDDLFTLLDRLCDDGYEHITVYLTGHGNEDLISLGYIHLTADDMVNFLNDHPETSFSFLFESCYIGSFINDLQVCPNVRLVLTSTSTLYPAYGDKDPDYDPNPIDGGSEWTSSLYWGALDQLSNVGWTNIVNEANRISAPPSIVLLLAAFNNAGSNDSRDLNACYLGGEEFPQAWSEYSTLCRLWQQPPLGVEGYVGLEPYWTGVVTSSGSISKTSHLYIGEKDSARGFVSYAFIHVIPEGSTVLTVSASFSITTASDCIPGYISDLVVEHLPYSILDRSDFNATAEEISRIPIDCISVGNDIWLTLQLGGYFQQDIDNDRGYSQYRIRFTGNSGIAMLVWTAQFYYELR